MEGWLVAAALALAFVNGANDNVKAVATLQGSGQLGYRSALTLATLAQLAGSLCSVLLAAGLVHAFSGKGLLPAALLTPALLTAVAAAAALTVAGATLAGLPVSTTHAIVGALAGAGVAAAGSALDAGALGRSFALPLLVGPIAAIAVASLLLRAGSDLAGRLGLTRRRCICVEAAPCHAPAFAGSAAARAADAAAGRDALAPAALRIEVAPVSACRAHSALRIAGIDVDRAARRAHQLSALAVGFARGLNDTPKILGLLVAATVVSPIGGALAIGAAMALGGWLCARRVSDTLAHRITPMREEQGLASNLATALLVVGASRLGLPVSTTHVATGGIFGIGAAARTLRMRAAGGILGAWVGTLPIAAALAAAIAWGIA